ncbi:phenylalanine--tRNA ligase subunit alpha [Candidatus Pacearchaeota archaeon]|nr:phenylalanine--tRNA ligase subunit alpha [Candidatus Pacearchaeota archaeon]
MTDNKKIEEIIERLSPIERSVIPHLKSSFHEIKKKSSLDETSLIRALRFLELKGILKISQKERNIVDLGTNGIYYKKNHLPERTLLLVLDKNNHLPIEEAQKTAKLSDNEFKVSLGVLKDKALITINKGRISLNASKDELMKKSFEEQFLETLPREYETLPPEMLHAFENLKVRKDIIELRKEKDISFSLTDLGESIAGMNIESNLLEEVTPELIKNWTKGNKFRKYDIQARVPHISGGKRHFVNQAINYGKRIWLDMGFKEMTGKKVVTSFWNFDALFTAQDHPVREMHDTFFIKDIKGNLPDKEIVKRVKEAHESGVSGSKGWKYLWNEEEAKKVLLRTHTTVLSSQTLAKLKKEDLPAKYFAIGKCFRNETVDWKHGFEFNQTEGIVIDPKANLSDLLGYLSEFSKKMGFDKIRFQPSFFPYTEPSVEGLVWNESKKEWIEVFAAGIFRPEVTVPLLGESIPVLAWGPGFDRLMMMAYEIKDLRELYSNDIKKLRDIPLWSK